jgi:CsoR family transcriptional regulator, copper-sensing transcriptional repressor
MQHADNTQKITRRLKLIEGQVRGLQRMIDEGVYCVDVITQTSAVKQALSNVEDLLLEGHIAHCVINQVRAGKPHQATAELLKVYKLKRN